MGMPYYTFILGNYINLIKICLYLDIDPLEQC